MTRFRLSKLFPLLKESWFRQVIVNRRNTVDNDRLHPTSEQNFTKSISLSFVNPQRRLFTCMFVFQL